MHYLMLEVLAKDIAKALNFAAERSHGDCDVDSAKVIMVSDNDRMCPFIEVSIGNAQILLKVIG